MLETSEDSPRYAQMQQKIASFIKSQTEPVTTAQVVRHVKTYDFVWDSLEFLESTKVIENVGGIQISRWVYASPKKREKPKKRKCPACQKTKALVEFYQEWSGAPSKLCKSCKTKKASTRKKKDREVSA